MSAPPPNPHGARKVGEDPDMDQAFERLARTDSAKQKEDLQPASKPPAYNPMFPSGNPYVQKPYNAKPEVGLPDKIVIDQEQGPVELPHTEDERRARDAFTEAQRAKQAQWLQRAQKAEKNEDAKREATKNAI